MDVDATRVAKGMYWQRAWSLVEGCTPCAPECLNCWSAEQTNMRQHRKCPKTRARYSGLVNANGKFNGQVRFMEADLEKPLRTRKPTVWSVWNDLFHKTVTDEQIGDAFAVMLRAPRHRFLILTKRPERMAEWFRGFYTGQQPSKNVALGTTVGHPDSLWRIGELLKCPAAMRSLSVEPLLEELDLTTYLTPADRDHIGEDYGTWVAGKWQPPLDQLIIGPETGPGARPCKLEWIESLVDQADAAGLAVFVKAFPIDGRVSKDMAEWPEWARRREFPEWGGDDG